MVGRRVQVAAAAAMILAAAGACTPPDSGGGSTTTTTTISVDDHDALVAACTTERATIRTAYQAAAVMQAFDPTETMFDFVDPSSVGVWFEVESGPTTGPVQRSAATLALLPATDCASISLAEVPLGSY